MLRRVNIPRRLAATWCALIIMLTAPNVSARGQADVDGLPDAGAVVEAYSSVRRWVRAFGGLPKLNESESSLPIDGCSGVCVILRLDGTPVGIGVDTAGDDLMVRRATGRALGEVLRAESVARLPLEVRDEVGGRLTVELEVAGALRPLAGLNFRDMAEHIEPGLEGAALRHGEKTAILFPAVLRTTNTMANIGTMLPGLADDVGLTLDDLVDLPRSDVSVYSFRTTHLAQTAPNRSPFQTHRGGTIVSIAEVTGDGIVDLADGLARHLLASVWPDPPPDELGAVPREELGLQGNYQPDLDEYQPMVAPPLEQALAAFALARYANAPGVHPLVAEEARAGAIQILSELETRLESEAHVLEDPRACAAVVYALSECPDCADDPGAERLLKAAVEVVLAGYVFEVGFAPEIQGHAQAMVVGAIARLARDRGPESMDLEVLRLALDAAWSALPDNLAVGLLPWMLWAEYDYAAVTGIPLAHIDRFQRLISLLERSRITASRAPGVAADLVGGFDLSDDVTPLATAQSARPAVVMAIVPRDPDLGPAPAVALGRHFQTIRFLMQLSVRESDRWALPSPQRALGGIRTAPWDNEQSVAAQAMALLAAAETLFTLDSF